MTRITALSSKPLRLAMRDYILKWLGLFSVAVAFVVISLPYVFADSDHVRIAKNQMGQSHLLKLGLNKSVIIDLPVQVKDVIISNPNVASGFMKTARRAVVQGKTSGETNVFFLDANGRNIAVFEISIVQGTKVLTRTIRRLIPGSNIRAEAVGDGTGGAQIVLSGYAESPEDAVNAGAIAARFAGGDSNSVLNLVEINSSQQVMLKVTVAEVEREIVKQLGINLGAGITTSDITGLIQSSPSIGGVSAVVSSDSVSATAKLGDVSIEAVLRALERKGAAKLLAEPTLTALSGKSAEFMAGGEFPMPSSVERDSDGNVAVGLERVEFGVKLNFTPVVHSVNQITLDVETSVSDISSQGGYEAFGVSLSGTRERNAKTSVELGSGSTLAIAGLIEETTKQQINEFPGLANIPIIGALFRSRDFIRSETELLILVTPYLAQPGNEQDFIKPSDKIRFAGDAAATFLGKMEERYAVGEKGQPQYFEGEVGFIFD